ncbi:hypothetical protein JG687_00006665 [Phytophthora cactorum]|uniref:PiggyBac transposable element-derived protein domain-containing protein n=1 Tax=Phytophthora cactorum TaxID=29920 RepID=A0A8T1UM69_9STRA|nr:hypothetical protein JG687_00006665 [Phytophthora cactorum]
MTCCATSSYCLRLEVYCGREQHTQEMQSADHNTAPSAIMRNLEAVLPPQSDGIYRLIVTDRYYTSVQLAYQLLQRQVYCVGTIQDDRQGFCDAMKEKNRNRPRSIAHGTTRMAVAKNSPQMTSLVWWARRPVQMLATGASRSTESCCMYCGLFEAAYRY